MYLYLYNLIISFYFFGIKIAALFNSKAKKWISGRKNLLKKIDQEFNKNRDKIVWMHCASLGEFEQGKPILEHLKVNSPQYKILITFFSPSGYEIKKETSLANWVYYLPADNKTNAQKFISLINPSIAIFVKNEFWFHFLNVLNSNQIPTFLIAASFRDSQPFFKWYGSVHRKMLMCFDKIFVQDNYSQELLKTIDCNETFAAGDPRVDSVLSGANQKISLPFIQAFCSNKKVLICGSTWEKDENLIASLLREESLVDWKVIIAPHNISANRIEYILHKFNYQSVTLSEFVKTQKDLKVLIIDSIGLLSKLYAYGTLVYIGGGFGAGIHNTLEPMAFSLPVIYGPRWEKFIEAKEMIKRKGHFAVKNDLELIKVFMSLQDPSNYELARMEIKKYMKENSGATQAIVQIISEYL